MREIQSRGLLFTDNSFVYGNYVFKDGESYIQELSCEETLSTLYHVRNNTIGSYIGILDKNYHRIFEHDIIHSCFGCIDYEFLALYNYKARSFMFFDIKNNESHNINKFQPHQLEIIGNVHMIKYRNKGR